jgi:hypothetical protein
MKLSYHPCPQQHGEAGSGKKGLIHGANRIVNLLNRSDIHISLNGVMKNSTCV